MRLFGRDKSDVRHVGSEQDALVAALNQSRCLAWFDRSGKVIEANDRFCETLGYNRSEIAGISHSDLVGADLCGSDADKSFAEIFSGQPNVAAIVPRCGKTGKTVWLQTTYVPLPGSDGKPHKLLMIAEEVPESHAEKHNNLEQFAAVAASQAMVVYDPEGAILLVSERYAKMFGYARDEMIGRHHRDFVHPDYVTTDDYDTYLSNAQSGTTRSGTVRRHRKDGSGIWVQWTICPVRDDRGKLTKLVKLATDVTRLEEARSMNDVISRVLAVIEFNTDGTIRHANDLFLSAMGYRLEEIVGKHHRMFMPDGEASTPAYADHWRNLAAGKFHIGEYRRKTKSGDDLWISGTYNPVLDSRGKVVKIVKYASDITPRVTAVRSLSAELARLAKGDLTPRIADAFANEFEPLRQDFNRTLEHLTESMLRLVRSSGEIESGTHDINSASDDLSRRTESQAAALAESSAAITEIAVSVTSTSQAARETNEMVAKAQARATAGSTVMTEAREAMTALATSSSEISKITSLIEDIAFQTNLLALNAGVEAARAGEAGRGFAVVASEVRALAQRSSEAATQIARLIDTSVKQVENGVSLVTQTGEELTEIDKVVGEVALMVGSISTAADEQANGISEIKRSIGELDDVTQKNVAMFEETKAATQLLANEVRTLSEITASFVLDQAHGAAGASQAGLRRAS